MKRHHLAVSKTINAPAHCVYAILADYHVGHRRILPRPPFVSMCVKRGGLGSGTRFDLTMRFLGRQQIYHGIVSEPQPGRVLVENYEGTELVTSFIVEPLEEGKRTGVTIVTECQVHDGVLGRMEAWLADAMLRPVYIQELDNLADLHIEPTFYRSSVAIDSTIQRGLSNVDQR